MIEEYLKSQSETAKLFTEFIFSHDFGTCETGYYELEDIDFCVVKYIRTVIISGRFFA